MSSQHRQNGFGALRLIFASMVIAAHTPELVDGNRSREILTRLFGTITFGDMAVDCFFVVSGYLIAKSWLNDPRTCDYLRKRVARIYPGYLVNFALCLLVVAPLGGAALSAPSILDPLRLESPMAPGVFSGTPYPVLNGSAWTIAYEFRCYILVLLLGLAGALRSARIVLALTLAAAALYLVVPVDWTMAHTETMVGNSSQMLRLGAVFLVGMLFYIGRKRITFTRRGMTVSVALLIPLLFVTSLAHFGVAVFGGYLIFALAKREDGILTRINNENDVSYGLYLYAWPIEKLLMWYAPGLPLLVYGGLTLVLAYGAGWISWLAIEQPTMRLASRLPPAGGTTLARLALLSGVRRALERE